MWTLNSNVIEIVFQTIAYVGCLCYKITMLIWFKDLGKWAGAVRFTSAQFYPRSYKQSVAARQKRVINFQEGGSSGQPLLMLIQPHYLGSVIWDKMKRRRERRKRTGREGAGGAGRGGGRLGRWPLEKLKIDSEGQMCSKHIESMCKILQEQINKIKIIK